MRYYFIFLFISTFSFAQNLNEFQYALVPAKFSFLKEPNEYNMNVLTKMFMEKYGFEAHLDSEILPDDFASTNCNKVFVDLIENSSLFSTKIKVVIKDCKNQVLYTSQQGSSREKDFKIAYNQALRQAFESFSSLHHKFLPSQKSMGSSGESAQIIVDKNKIDALNTDFNPRNEFAQNQMNFKKYTVFAFENGFNLITPASDYKIFQIFKTSVKDVFIANRDKVAGVLIKKTDSWFFEYYEGNVLRSELIKVSF